MQAKLLSIIIPVYNGEKYISKCMQKLLRNPYPDFEILIGDDGSTDSTWSEIEKFKHEPRIRAIRLPLNHGAGAMRNALIASAKGEYIALQDVDDDFELTRFCEQIDLIERSQVDVVGSWSILQDPNTHDEWGSIKVSERPTFKDWFMLKSMVHASIVLRRSCLEGVKYHEKLSLGEDYYFLIQLYLRKLKIVNLPKFLYNYRISQSRLRGRSLSKIVQILEANWQIAKLWPWYLVLPFYGLHLIKLVVGVMRSLFKS